MKDPIYSTMQYPHYRDDNGPLPFFGFFSGIDEAYDDKFRDIWAGLDFKLSDFCRIHQIVYKHISEIDKRIDLISEINLNSNSDDVAKALLRQSLYSQELENRGVYLFVDHLTIVGLWTISEQTMSKIYRRLESIRENIPETRVKTPYKWEEFIKKFKQCGVELENCMNFNNANECRVVNNAIKHEPVVNEKLTQFDYFSSYSGNALEKTPLEMQRYFNGVSDFLVSVIDESNKSLATHLSSKNT